VPSRSQAQEQPKEPVFFEEDTVPEVVDEEEVTGPPAEWQDGTYAGYACKYREVRPDEGEWVVTKRGNVYARKGDYVVNGLDEAPKGYHSQTIARVVRVSDSNLVK
jgi:hypothetical protein